MAYSYQHCCSQEFSAADNVTLIIKTQSFHSGDDFHNKAREIWKSYEIMVINRLRSYSFIVKTKRKSLEKHIFRIRILEPKRKKIAMIFQYLQWLENEDM